MTKCDHLEKTDSDVFTFDNMYLNNSKEVILRTTILLITYLLKSICQKICSKTDCTF